MPRKRKTLTPEECAEAIEQVASDIEKGEASMKTQVLISNAQIALLSTEKREIIDRVMLLHRVGFLLLGGTATGRYERADKLGEARVPEVIRPQPGRELP